MAQAASPARAWIGTIVFLFLAPGIVGGLIPWLISRWQWYDWGGAAWFVVPIAWIAIGVGVAFLLHAFALFALHRGTPAPVAPTETLVVTGVYRFVRNPMYLSVLAIILGQALLFGSWWLVLYAGIALAAVVAFVKGYEEPTLTGTYGEQYLEYRRNVPGGGRGSRRGGSDRAGHRCVCESPTTPPRHCRAADRVDSRRVPAGHHSRGTKSWRSSEQVGRERRVAGCPT